MHQKNSQNQINGRLIESTSFPLLGNPKWTSTMLAMQSKDAVPSNCSNCSRLYWNQPSLTNHIKHNDSNQVNSRTDQITYLTWLHQSNQVPHPHTRTNAQESQVFIQQHRGTAEIDGMDQTQEVSSCRCSVDNSPFSNEQRKKRLLQVREST